MYVFSLTSLSKKQENWLISLSNTRTCMLELRLELDMSALSMLSKNLYRQFVDKAIFHFYTQCFPNLFGYTTCKGFEGAYSGLCFYQNDFLNN